MKKFLLLMLIGFLAACEQAVVEEVPTTYQITYELTHLNIQRRFSYDEGERLFLVPTQQDGYDFAGWYLDANLTIPFTETVMPGRDITLYPKFDQIPLPDFDEPIIPITDRSELSLPDICRIQNAPGSSYVVAGFPISEYRLPSVGTITVQVLFIDFPDFIGVMDEAEIQKFFQPYMQGIDEFFRIQSFGRMSFEFRLHPDFVRMNRELSSLSLLRKDNAPDLDYIIRESIRLSDEYIDYTDVDMVISFLNPDIPESIADVSPAWPMEEAGKFLTNEGPIYNGTVIAGDGVRIGYSTIAHEIGHLFGLADLYNYNWQENNPTNDWLRQFDFTGVYDFMGFGDPTQFGDNRDMLAWQRYLLDWITNEQVRCVDPTIPSETTHELIASHLTEEGDKLIVLPLNSTKALVIEVKDRNQYCFYCNGGVYTYVVDTTYGNGLGLVRLVRPQSSTRLLLEDAYLNRGEQLVYENITITFEKVSSKSIVRVLVE